MTKAVKIAGPKTPDAIDKHVGARVRIQRTVIGMSQEELGDALGLTFQQVQKYEKGMNRIGAGRLQQIAQHLGVDVAYFYEGAPGAGAKMENTETGALIKFMQTREGVRLVRGFSAIENPMVRSRILGMVEAVAGGGEEARV